MTTVKRKFSTVSPAKAVSLRGSTAGPAGGSPSASSGTALARSKVSRKVACAGSTSVAQGSPFRARLLQAIGPVSELNITDARTQMPKMIRSSQVGEVYLIANAKNADSPPAVLIGMGQLERVVREASRPQPGRTLGDVLASLPFSGMALRPPRAARLPDDDLPKVQLPR